MKAQAEYLRNLLINDLDVSNIVGTNVNWEIAPATQEGPCINFSIVENIARTKDARDYNAELRFYADSLAISSDIHNAVYNVMVAQGSKFIAARSQYTDDQAEVGYIESNFNLKL